MFVDSNGAIEVSITAEGQPPERIVRGAVDEATALKNAEVAIAALCREGNAIRDVNGRHCCG